MACCGNKDVAKRNISIGRRIQTLVTASTGLAMAIVMAILAAYHLQDSVSARRTELISTSYIYASAIAEDMANGNEQGIERVFHSTARLHDVVGVYAVGRNGDVIQSAGKQVVLTSAMTSGEPDIVQMLTRGLMPVGVDIIRGGEPVGRLVMIGDISNIRAQLFKAITATLLAGLTALAIVQIFSTLVQRRISAPIVQLTKAMTELTQAHRYEPTTIAGAEGETEALVTSFNGMISEIRTRDAALKQLAYFDQLTHLPNRSQFLQALEDAFAEAGKDGGFCVFLLDLDDFATLNDTLGQRLADELLTSVATLFGQTVQEGQLFARLGADEFGLIAPGVHSLEQAQRALAPFVAALYQPILVKEQAIHVSTGVGFALAGQHGADVAELLRHANLALAEAKRHGQGRIVPYYPELGERIDEEAAIERGLRNAIENGEIEVHYQPIVNTYDAQVEGFEALMRWRRADGTFVPPAKFIPVAEKAGLIGNLGQWILQRACKDAASWIARGEKPRFVSVNISASQVLLSDFMLVIKSALINSGLAPKLLCIELTESLFAGRSMNLVRTVLQDAKALGVTTALDDFGTGYSSLSYLENLPFDKLKIDRSFVHQKSAGAKGRPLLKGIVDLAHALNIEIVAEGAELLEEVHLLRSLGAQFVQGYYFSRPLPAAEALAAAKRIEAVEARNLA